MEEAESADGGSIAADLRGELTETASGAFESGIDRDGDGSAATASGAFDCNEAAFGAFDSNEAALSAFESAEIKSGAFESDETKAAPSGAFDAVGGVAIGMQAALWPPSQCTRWQRAPQ